MCGVVFEAEASGGSKAGGRLPTLSFPLSLPSPFHSIQFSDKPVGGKVRSSEGEVPRLPPYKYNPDHVTSLNTFSLQPCAYVRYK